MASAKHNRTPAQFNRRNLLAAVPAIAVCAAPAIAAAETPVMKLFRQWKPLNAFLDGKESDVLDQEVFNVELRRLYALEVEMLEAPAENMADLAAKIVAITVDGERELMGPSVIPDFWAEVRTLVAA